MSFFSVKQQKNPLLFNCNSVCMCKKNIKRSLLSGTNIWPVKNSTWCQDSEAVDKMTNWQSASDNQLMRCVPRSHKSTWNEKWGNGKKRERNCSGEKGAALWTFCCDPVKNEWDTTIETFWKLCASRAKGVNWSTLWICIFAFAYSWATKFVMQYLGHSLYLFGLTLIKGSYRCTVLKNYQLVHFYRKQQSK